MARLVLTTNVFGFRLRNWTPDRQLQLIGRNNYTVSDTVVVNSTCAGETECKKERKKKKEKVQQRCHVSRDSLMRRRWNGNKRGQVCRFTFRFVTAKCTASKFQLCCSFARNFPIRQFHLLDNSRYVEQEKRFSFTNFSKIRYYTILNLYIIIYIRFGITLKKKKEKEQA